MNSRCSRERAEESLEDVFLVGEPSAQWRSTLTPRPSSSLDKTTGSSRHSLFGTMSALLTDDLGEDVLTSFRAAFRAKTYLQPGKARESTERGPDCGLNSRESFARFDRATRSWKIPRCLFPGVLDEFSETFPKSGMMLHGQCWELTTSELRTCEKESGYSRRTRLLFGTPTATMTRRSEKFMKGNRLPNPAKVAERQKFLTPTATDSLRSAFRLESLASHWEKHPKSNLSEQIAFETLFPTPRTKGLCGGTGSFDALKKLEDNGAITTEERRSMQAGNGGALNPNWVEWLMGWPIGWTALGASETVKCRCARRQHSESYTNK